MSISGEVEGVGVAHWRRLLRAATTLLSAAVVAGVLTMHVPPPTSHGAHAPAHAPTSAGRPAPSTAPSPQGSPTGVGCGPTGERSSTPAADGSGAGRGAPPAAHAVACDLSVPPPGSAVVLGTAALVAVVPTALLALPAAPAAGGSPQPRGPPVEERLRLSTSVIRT